MASLCAVPVASVVLESAVFSTGAVDVIDAASAAVAAILCVASAVVFTCVAFAVLAGAVAVFGFACVKSLM